ncbi:MAG: hypothetical protein IJC43_08565, partial [Clostridia bacterium]|nr:hypothetical protein [Clostridia bacterium]
MNKRLVWITLTWALLLCLAGCHHDPVEQEDAERIAEKGAEMMQTWLDEQMPDAEMTECAAFLQNIAYTGREYLTDYATGRIRVDGEETVFAVDTVTGDVYFAIDQQTKEALNEIAAAYLYDTMGVTPAGGDNSFACHVLAPFRDDEHELEAYQFHYGFDFGLPADVEDLEAFVRDPQSRVQIEVTAEITLPDDADLSGYDLERMEQLGNSCGMRFRSMTIANSTQTFRMGTREWMTTAGFSEYGDWLDRDGISIDGRVRVREEERNDLTNEMTKSDRRFDPEQDLVFEKTATGYQFYLPNEDWQEEVFYIRASEGAGILEYNYIEYFYSDVAGFIAGEYDIDEEDGTELI